MDSSPKIAPSPDPTARVVRATKVAGANPRPAVATVPGIPRKRQFTDGQILDSMNFVVPTSQLPAGYGVALAMLAGCLVLLPVMYGALLAFLGWLAVWHAIQAVVSFSYGPYFVFHVPMALLGSVLVLFLIKPIFSRRKKESEGVLSVTEADEPLLFAVIARLCAATGAKMPSRIEVDCQPNAHARFRRASDSVKNGDLVLRIGLPLAAALSVRQLAGVIGHELGHFNQRRGMAGFYLIRRLSGFFARVVFERDRIDQQLIKLRNKRDPIARLIYYSAVVFVEPTRGLLWLMLIAGELLTCRVLRRMEYDADAVEAHVAGVNEFVRTGKLLLFLDLASRRARTDLADAFEKRLLADDLPRLIVANAKQLSEHRTDILKLLDQGKTRWFDTHPCHNDRVASVTRIGAEGLLDCDAPASALFANFRALCQLTTDAMYRSLLGEKVLDDIKLVPTKELARERGEQRSAATTLHKYFRAHVIANRPIFPGDLSVPFIDLDSAVAELTIARRDVHTASTALPVMIRQYVEAGAILPIVQAQIALCDVFRNNPKTARVRSKMQKLLRKHGPLQQDAITKLTAFEEAAGRRFTLALQLMDFDSVTKKIGKLAAGGSMPQLLEVTAAIEQCSPVVRRLTELLPRVHVLGAAHNFRQPHQPLVQQILASTREVTNLLQRLQKNLTGVPFPYSHGTPGVTLAGFVVQRMPKAQDPVDTFETASRTLDRFHTLTFRTLAMLTQWAEAGEIAVGLEPLPDVPNTDDQQTKVEAAASSRHSRKYWIGYGSRAAAGIAMVSGMVYLSVYPPELPRMPWQNKDDTEFQYRPASFQVSYHAPASPFGAGLPALPQPYFPYQGHIMPMQVHAWNPPPTFTPNAQPGVFAPPGHFPAFPSSAIPAPMFPQQPNFPSNQPMRGPTPFWNPQPAGPTGGFGGGAPPGGGGRRR